MTEPLVSVLMITYNHAPFITQAIEGVIKQKTNFPFELVIGEDCSTDGTNEIVFEYQKKYPDIIRVITSDENVGGRKNAQRTMKACDGQYIAFCEGDDYWTDPCKMQKQVDFLENNSDYAMVHTASGLFIQSTKKFYKNSNKRLTQLRRTIPSGYIYENLLIANLIGTLSVLVKKNILLLAQKELEGVRGKWKMGDYPLWIEIAKHHKIKYLGEAMAVYRSLPHSASHNKDRYQMFLFEMDAFYIKLFFIKKYDAHQDTIYTVKKKYNEMVLKMALKLNDSTLLVKFPLFEDVKASLKTRACQLGLKYSGLRNFAKIYVSMLTLLEWNWPFLSQKDC